MEPITYRFGDFSVDLPRMALSRNGQPLLVEPKAFDVLCVLIEHRDRLVTKDELLDAVWKDTFVTPNVLTRVVAQLRKALGDDAQEARYIETVTKRGYRFIAAITIEASSETPVGVRATSPASIPAQIAKFTSSTAFTGVAMLFAIVLLVALAIRGGTRP
ncbi:MAG: winged helix-turn-helix domain-containing protein, partial [Vicinamibacterales bacterium]